MCLSTFWNEVNIGENERWFRVYTGLFETPNKAKMYRAERNLVESLVMKTPQHTSVIDYPDLQGHGDKILSNMQGKTPAEQAPPEILPMTVKRVKKDFRKQATREKPTGELPAMYTGPFFGTASRMEPAP